MNFYEKAQILRFFRYMGYDRKLCSLGNKCCTWRDITALTEIQTQFQLSLIPPIFYC